MRQESYANSANTVRHGQCISTLVSNIKCACPSARHQAVLQSQGTAGQMIRPLNTIAKVNKASPGN